MNEKNLSVQIESLASECSRLLIEEKWVVAPTLRIGFQWLDRVTRSGQPAVNCRIKTMRTLALGLATTEMEKKGLTYLRRTRQEVIIDGIFETLKREGRGYLLGLDPTPGLLAGLTRTVSDLRLSGLEAGNLSAKSFEVGEKGSEIKKILAAYEREMSSQKLIDYAGALAIAVQRLKSDHDCLPDSVVLLMPADMAEGLHGLERELWDALPEKRRVIIEVDRPGKPAGKKPSDLALLSDVLDPAKAAPPSGDGTVSMFRALGEVNEVREVFRKCLALGVALDQVEIIHTDYQTYVPIIHELATLIGDVGESAWLATFEEGVPVRYSRPGRALTGFVEWAASDFPQWTLVRMIQDGLMEIDQPEESAFSFTRLAQGLSVLPIGNGADRYLPALDKELGALERRLKSLRKYEGADENEPRGKTKDVIERIAVLKILRAPVADLLDLASPDGGQAKRLEGVLEFLGKYVRSAGQLDEYGLHSLGRSLREMKDCLEESEASGINIMDWLMDLPRSSSVGGLGPRPGRAYVSSIRSGGHSGRPYTFIVGLDDGRFPGAGSQDPLLLDSERNGISRELPTSSGRVSKTMKDFAGLLARLRGNVTLSFSCRAIDDDREMFPSPALLSIHRIVSGERESGLDKLNESLGAPVSFAPGNADRCLDLNEWLLWRLCGEEQVKGSRGFVAEAFPNLGRGLVAKAGRDSDRFTEYDGYVPEAASACDPAAKGGPIMSASRLEKLAACPLEYFFSYVLDIEAPEEYVLDSDQWLDPAQKGGLLHETFRAFMAGLCSSGELPDFKRDLKHLMGVLDKQIEEAADENPPPSRVVFEREKRELELVARIFLKEEESHCRSSEPCYFEAALGMRPEGDDKTPLDTDKPVSIELPGGRKILGRGRIDRIDRVGDDFSIWDYKTGSAWKYRQGAPFWQGRCVQNAFYLLLAGARIKEVHPGASIRDFGYFFPSAKEHGERIKWDRQTLEEGRHILSDLCDLLSRGSFPFTDSEQDFKYSDYKEAFGEVATNIARMKRKLEAKENDPLAPFRRLRGYEKGGE